MSKNAVHSLATRGESIAVDFLQQHGFEVLKRNFHSAYGEIDIIAKFNDELIFIEVKTRSKPDLFLAESSITLSKRKKITLTADYFLYKHEEFSQLSCRFDAIIILYYNSDDSFRIVHHTNFFQAIH